MKKKKKKKKDNFDSPTSHQEGEKKRTRDQDIKNR